MTPNPLYNSPCSNLLFTQTRAVDPLDPESFVPDLAEIMHALPNINRYNGHTTRPYSVAEHSINCMFAGMFNYGFYKPHHKLFFLLHDAAEAYLQDIVRPLKRFMSDDILLAEKVINGRVLDLLPFTEEQRDELYSQSFTLASDDIDTRMAVTEIVQLLPNHKNPLPGFEPYTMSLYPPGLHCTISVLFKSHIAQETENLKKVKNGY